MLYCAGKVLGSVVLHRAEAGGSAPRIELEGTKRLLDELHNKGLTITRCTIDGNLSVAKLLRERHIEVSFDLHHVGKIVSAYTGLLQPLIYHSHLASSNLIARYGVLCSVRWKKFATKSRRPP